MFGEDSYLDSSWEDRFESVFGYEDDVNEGYFEDDGWDDEDDDEDLEDGDDWEDDDGDE